ncbi:hypothetical protein DQ384_34625 [Sphaerisporangium album]|uniref:Lactococcin 972 family bacteriocin n=1 Tax=Sphaerisporangium album TaxID=509200 RepID=A0A367EXE5_9ACTN|nr:hypothetical protein [Sphaerisporangium album]RCG22743.1 hypothetical protein DQ384_34625 [Sphaerisporangium album]
MSRRRIAVVAGGLLAAAALLPVSGAYAAYAQISGKVTGWTHDSHTKISVRNEHNDNDVYGNYFRTSSENQLNINNTHSAGTVVTSAAGSSITRIRVGVSRTGPDELSAWSYN